MSYDLHGFRVPPGRTVEEYYEDEEREEALMADDRPPTAEERAEMERLAAAVLAHDPTLERSDGKDHIELTSKDAIQVSLFKHEAGITVPYWYEGDKAHDILIEMYELAELLTRESGLSFYDPQTGEEVSGLGVADAYASGVRATQAIAAKYAAAPPPAPPKKRGWLSKLTRRD